MDQTPPHRESGDLGVSGLASITAGLGVPAGALPSGAAAAGGFGEANGEGATAEARFCR